ncbi:hypothetical protein ACIOGZ_07955 [Kitasatospora sp. NPDC088160]|uniref:hypothetical protein n=1 Tax=Kitasatospora sp. NPDC088160 TaxID=3364072 RepID=UPI0038089428
MTLFELADAPTFEDDRTVIHPGKVPASGQRHWLLVEDELEDALSIEHTDDCLNQWGEIGCDVAFHAEDGLDLWFHQADTDEGYYGSIGLRPGRYLIEAWSTRSWCEYYGTWEYDGGLGLVYPEEAE